MTLTFPHPFNDLLDLFLMNPDQLPIAFHDGPLALDVDDDFTLDFERRQGNFDFLQNTLRQIVDICANANIFQDITIKLSLEQVSIKQGLSFLVQTTSDCKTRKGNILL